jgi:hypothetical protein
MASMFFSYFILVSVHSFHFLIHTDFFVQVNVFRPAMMDVSDPMEGMADHLLLGMHLFNPVIDPEGFKHWTRRLYGSITDKYPATFDNSFSK